MHTSPLKTLLAGVGGRGGWATRLCTPANGFEIVSLCDPSQDALSAAGTALNLAPDRWFTDLDSALAAGGLDCLIICAPTRFHVPYAIAGFKAGLSVLTEKGMAADWAGAVEVVTAASAHKAVLCVAQNYRYRAMESAITACLTGGRPDADPGRLYMVDYAEHRVRPNVRTLTFPFASVWDMSSHHFDNLLSWLGPVEAITAQAFGAPWSAYEFPNNTSAHLEFASGVRVNYFHGHDCARGEVRVAFQGERGALIRRGDELTFNERPLEQFGTRPIHEVALEPDLNELGVLRDFRAYVTEGVEPGISGYNNLEVMAICQMLVLSASEGRRVLRSELETPARPAA
jgi:predicted dehydrogenase